MGAKGGDGNIEEKRGGQNRMDIVQAAMGDLLSAGGGGGT